MSYHWWWENVLKFEELSKTASNYLAMWWGTTWLILKYFFLFLETGPERRCNSSNKVSGICIFYDLALIFSMHAHTHTHTHIYIYIYIYIYNTTRAPMSNKLDLSNLSQINKTKMYLQNYNQFTFRSLQRYSRNCFIFACMKQLLRQIWDQ